MADDEISIDDKDLNDQVFVEKVFSFEEFEVKDHDNDVPDFQNNESTEKTETTILADDEDASTTREENTSTSDKDENKKGNDEDDLNSISYLNAQPLPTLEELANSDYLFNRQLAARKILESLQQAGSNEKELQSVISVMCKLSEDEEAMVQFELMQHIPAIASYCQSEPHLRIIIRQQLVPYTVKLLNDIQVMVRRSGQTTLLVLLEKNLIDQSQLIEWICPLIAQLVLCENNLEELRIEDVSLMTKMIPLVGRETTRKFFLEPYVSLCCDPLFGIRKMCAFGFGTLCPVVGVETTELTLLPAFLNLCNDEMWGVRKACANVFVDVAKSVSLKTRREVLPHIFVNLLTDNSSYVKCGACQNLGAFIYTFADPKQTGCYYKDGKISVKRTSLSWKLSQSNNNESPKIDSESQNSQKLPNVDTIADPSLAVTTKNRHVYLHVDNENLFNNFQFWRVPLPEIELDVDIEEDKISNIHMRTEVPNEKKEVVSIVKDCSFSFDENIASNTHMRAEVPNEKKVVSKVKDCSFFFKYAPAQNMKREINRVNFEESRKRCGYKFREATHDVTEMLDDTDMLRSSFKKAVLTFKTDDSNESTDCFGYDIITSEIKETSIVQEILKNEVTPDDQDIVPPILLYQFNSVVNNRYEWIKSYEDEKLVYVAFSFPAVALTLGEKYWPCIRKTCEKLSRDSKLSVRRTIASSLHELASILGHDIIMADLLPIFFDLFNDVDEVRLPLVQHLSDFIKHLSPQDRKQFLPLIEEFTELDNERNWRFRFAVAEQLREIVDLFDASDIKDSFFALASMFLIDKVSAVRLSAVQLTAVLLQKMRQDSHTESECDIRLIEYHIALRRGQKWILRQTYILLCEQIVLKNSISMAEFVKEIASDLFSLAYDKVPNVRLVLAKTILSTYLPMNIVSYLSSTPSQEVFMKAIEHLSSDVDRDVKFYGEKALSVIK